MSSCLHKWHQADIQLYFLPMKRRQALQLLTLPPALAACENRRTEAQGGQASPAPPVSPLLQVQPLSSSGRWPTLDPFLFCTHHRDAYPRGNAELGPAATLEGRPIGQDFSQKDGWSMYHGRVVPGFPVHPHRGFETITIVRQGFIDHADSLGAAARYGQGDVQWLTAGAGIQHAEMFPLLSSQEENPVELFQIWLNLPQRNKMVPPHFTMHWSSQIPQWSLLDDQGRAVHLSLHAGQLGSKTALAPPPHSWAAQPENEVLIATIRLAAHARWSLPAASPGLRRALYFFTGHTLRIAQEELTVKQQIELRPELPVLLENGSQESEILLLQGRPLGEPIAQRGPFVLTTQRELHAAFSDYQTTRFGGWPWEQDSPTHGNKVERFARHPDGKWEYPPAPQRTL